VLFLVFFRYGDADVDVSELEIRDDQPRWQTAVMVASLCLLHGLLVILLTAVFAFIVPHLLSAWANALGLMGAILAAVQYLPQIYTTYHLKHVGSLSIPMMCIQTPGGFLFAGSLFIRLGWEGWSSWGIFLLTAIMQGMLLSMAIYYEVQRNRNSESRLPPSPKPDDLAAHAVDYRRPPYDDDSTPSRWTAHPEIYGTTPDEIGDIIDRQDQDAATETQPLLRPGGIGHPGKKRDYTEAE